MTVIDSRRQTAVLPWLLREAAIATWRELPTAMGASAIWLASIVPLALAAVIGWWWLIAITSLPVALATTGVAQVAASIVRGERPRVRTVFRVDPVLALSWSAAGTGAALLIASDLRIVGFILGAVALVVAPFALGYGAMRRRRGLIAWRGGAILVAYRPSWSLTLLSIMLLSGFAVVATAGTLGLVFPVAFGAAATAVVGHLLDTIDESAPSSQEKPR